MTFKIQFFSLSLSIFTRPSSVQTKNYSHQKAYAENEFCQSFFIFIKKQKENAKSVERI